ncbi:hypothetical protein PLANPX_4250 [Lacipirellula parvula]|uniref:Uncharacterized protein n=1 Tax=Lacipirellula parvula TaxID=2650471 RepID=A0A5K7XDS8_9BACT|nr:hypothetical protein PLANPX_4250 [Lacipirellula parvula]
MTPRSRRLRSRLAAKKYPSCESSAKDSCIFDGQFNYP